MHVEAKFAQAMELVDAGESCADHQDIESLICRVSHSALPACSIGHNVRQASQACFALLLSDLRGVTAP
jgi:hypothetical protein